MRKFYLSVFALLFLVTAQAFGQWQQTGPDGGIIYDVIVNGSEWIAQGHNTVYRSVDDGANWSTIHSGLPYTNITGLVKHGTSYVAGTKNGIFKWNGTTWDSIAPSSLYLSYSDGTTIYGFASPMSSTYLYNSSDGGATYGVVNISGTPAYIPMASNGSYLYVATTTGSKVNFTGTWTGMTSTGGGIIDIKNFSTGIFAISASGLYKNSGSLNDITWYAVSGLPAGYIYSKIEYNNGIYFLLASKSNRYTVFTSPDLSTWTENSSGLPGGKIFNLRKAGSSVIAATTFGVYATSDNGVTWVPKNTNLKGLIVSDLKATATTLFAGVNNTANISGSVVTYGGGVYRTADGTTWEKTSLPDSIGVEKLLIANNKIFAIGRRYAETGGYTLTSVYRSSDNGDTWQPLSDETKYTYSMVYHNNELFLGGGYDYQVGILKSSDDGDSWTKITTDFATTTNIMNLVSMNNNLFAANALYYNSGGGVFMSSDNGTNWSGALKNGLTNGGSGPVDYLGKSGNTLFADQFSSFYGATAVHFYSNDNGQNWIQINAGLPNQKVNSIYSNNGNTFMVSGLKGGELSTDYRDSGSVFYSPDYGISWQDLSGNLPEAGVQGVTAFNNQLYVGTYGADVWVGTLPSGSITSPAPMSSLDPGGSVLFTSTVENVTAVVLEYSADNGNTWNTITDNLPANNQKVASVNGQYLWTVPSINASTVTVRLKDYDSGMELNKAQYKITGATGIDNAFLKDFKLYPNPSSGSVYVEGKDNFKITIKNSIGTEMYKKEVTGSSVIDLSTLPKGLYHCRVEQGTSVMDVKLIVE